LDAVQGLASAWAYPTEAEPRTIHRDMLLAMGGEQVRALLTGDRTAYSLDRAGLTIGLDRGKMIFDTLDLLVIISRIPYRRVLVQVDDHYKLIGLLHFFKTINLVPEKGITVELGRNRTE